MASPPDKAEGPATDSRASQDRPSPKRTTGRIPGEGDGRLSRPGSKAGELQRAALAVVREHQAAGSLPTSGRFIFYELVARGAVPKQYPGGKRTPAQDVADALYRLRQLGVIPWGWIVDETRRLHSWDSAASVYDYTIEAAKGARIDCWGRQPPPLLLCESRSLAGVLTNLAAAYLVPLAATNGQVGGFLHTDIGPTLTAGQMVLYLGDWDWSGQQIEANTRAVLASYQPLRWERLALTADQAEGLPTIEKPDKRYRPHRTYPAVETEALSQADIVALVRVRLDSLLPEPLDRVLVRERRERADVADRLAR